MTHAESSILAASFVGRALLSLLFLFAGVALVLAAEAPSLAHAGVCWLGVAVLGRIEREDRPTLQRSLHQWREQWLNPLIVVQYATALAIVLCLFFGAASVYKWHSRLDERTARIANIAETARDESESK